MDVLFQAKQKNYYPPAKDHRLFFSLLSSRMGFYWIPLVISTFWRNPDNRSGQAEYTLTLGFCSLKHLGTKALNIFFETFWPRDPIKFVCLSGLDHRCQHWLLGLGASQVPGVCQSVFHQSVDCKMRLIAQLSIQLADTFILHTASANFNSHLSIHFNFESNTKGKVNWYWWIVENAGIINPIQLRNIETHWHQTSLLI